MVFSEVVGTLSFLQPQSDDDMADRLHYYYTTTFLLVTSVLISLKMFGGRPIECWMPAEYQNSWQEYTEIYCFSMNTYFAPFNKQIPTEQSVRDQNMISYYQWTPFFLVVCAFMFYSPCLLWRMLYTKSGIRLNDVVAFATDRSNIQPKHREANIKGVSAHLASVFKHRFRWSSVHGKDGIAHPYRHKFLRLLNLRFYEAYLTLLYIGIKILFLVNVSTQMFIMNWFLQTDAYNYYGWGVLQDLIQGKPWSDSGNFPRVTYCDMDVRILGNVQKHTVQCVLVINIFTEKVFVMLLVWYTFLVVVSLISLANWLISSLPFEARKKFIARRLELADVEFKRKNFHQELEEFVHDYIKMDGIFVLRMLTIHAGILVCTEIVDEMWEDYIRLNAAKFPKTPGGVSPSALSVEDGVGGKHSGTPSDRQPLLPRRKTSVLVPLVSARRDSLHPNFLHQVTPERPSSALPYATTAGLAAASHFLSPQPRSEVYLKTPNAQQWRMGRTRGGRVGGGPSGSMARPRNTRRSVSSTLAGVAGAAATLSAIHNAKQQQQQQQSYQPEIVIEDTSNESAAEDMSGAEESAVEGRSNDKERWLQPPTPHEGEP